MPSEDTKILEFNQNQKFDKAPSIIYPDFKSLIKKLGGCKNNLEKLSTTKVDKHTPSGLSISTKWTFDGIQNKHEKSCESIREHAMKIINFEKKKMIALKEEQQESYEKARAYWICKAC